MDGRKDKTIYKVEALWSKEATNIRQLKHISYDALQGYRQRNKFVSFRKDSPLKKMK